ncbi:MAG: glycosyltransferase family 2 protein [Gallionella sp.]|nr:glycosyltransferase family 2 protein [Gallionella sp.]
MKKPLVTIGITAFNAQDTIARAIQSALAQTWVSIEVVVVDDCSSDDTADRISEIATAHPNLRLIRHGVNTGVAGARNTILREARGEFVAFFDDDDVSAGHRIEAQVERIERYERTFAAGAPVICHTARIQLYPDGSSRVETTMGTSIGAPVPSGWAVAERILTGKPLRDGYGSLATCSQMGRTSTYRLVGGFDPSFRRSEDTDLSIRLALAGTHFAGIGEPLVTQEMMVTREKSLETELEFALVLLDKHRAQFRTPAEHALGRAWLQLKFEWLQGRRAKFFKGLLILGTSHPFFTLKRLTYALPMADSRASARRLHHSLQVKAHQDMT